MQYIATLEGCPECPAQVPELSGGLKLNVGPWSKLNKGKKFQKQGQLLALAGAATGNQGLVALGAGRYMQGRGKVKSAKRSIKTVTNVAKAVAVIGGTIATAGALGAFGAGAAGVGGVAGGGAGALGGIGGSVGAGGVAAGVSGAAGGGILSTLGAVGSGVLGVAKAAIPALAAPLAQKAQEMGMDPSGVMQAVQSGNIDQLPAEMQKMVTPAVEQAVQNFAQDALNLPPAGGVSFQSPQLTYDPATGQTYLEATANRGGDMKAGESGPGKNGIIIAGIAALGLGAAYMLSNQSKEKKAHGR